MSSFAFIPVQLWTLCSAFVRCYAVYHLFDGDCTFFLFQCLFCLTQNENENLSINNMALRIEIKETVIEISTSWPQLRWQWSKLLSSKLSANWADKNPTALLISEIHKWHSAQDEKQCGCSRFSLLVQMAQNYIKQHKRNIRGGKKNQLKGKHSSSCVFSFTF